VFISEEASAPEQEIKVIEKLELQYFLKT